VIVAEADAPVSASEPFDGSFTFDQSAYRSAAISTIAINIEGIDDVTPGSVREAEADCHNTRAVAGSDAVMEKCAASTGSFAGPLATLTEEHLDAHTTMAVDEPQIPEANSIVANVLAESRESSRTATPITSSCSTQPPPVQPAQARRFVKADAESKDVYVSVTEGSVIELDLEEGRIEGGDAALQSNSAEQNRDKRNKHSQGSGSSSSNSSARRQMRCTCTVS